MPSGGDPSAHAGGAPLTMQRKRSKGPSAGSPAELERIGPRRRGGELAQWSQPMTRYRLCRSTRSGHPPIHLTQPVLLQPSRSSCSSHFCTSVLNHISQPRIAILLNNTLRTRTAPASLCIHPASSTTATLRAIPLCFAFVVVELPGLQRNPSSYTTVIPSSTTTTTTTTNHVAILQLRCPAAPRPTSQRPLAQPPRRPIAEGAPDLGSAAQQAVPPSPHPQGIQRRAPHPHRIQARLRGCQVIRHRGR